MKSRFLTPDELEELESRCEARRSPSAVPRPVAQSSLCDEWAVFLGRYPLDTFFTLTFRDEYASEHFVYSPTSALNDFERFLKACKFPGQYFVAAEPHFCRDVPHLHGLLESCGLPLSNLWGGWFAVRGRARFEPPRTDAAVYYCSKYSLKDVKADSLRFRLENVGRRRQATRDRRS